jgi:hypothetical protein
MSRDASVQKGRTRLDSRARIVNTPGPGDASKVVARPAALHHVQVRRRWGWGTFVFSGSFPKDIRSND